MYFNKNHGTAQEIKWVVSYTQELSAAFHVKGQTCTCNTGTVQKYVCQQRSFLVATYCTGIGISIMHYTGSVNIKYTSFGTCIATYIRIMDLYFKVTDAIC